MKKDLNVRIAEQYEDMRENPKKWMFYYQNKSDRKLESETLEEPFLAEDLIDEDMDFMEGCMDSAGIKYDRIDRSIFDINNFQENR